MPHIGTTAAAMTAALVVTLSVAAADPLPRLSLSPWEEPGDSATVEILRIANRPADRFADVRLDSAGRIVGLPVGGTDILINNPAVCSPASFDGAAPAL